MLGCNLSIDDMGVASESWRPYGCLVGDAARRSNSRQHLRPDGGLNAARPGLNEPWATGNWHGVLADTARTLPEKDDVANSPSKFESMRMFLRH